MRQIKFRVWNKKTNSWVHEPGWEVNLFGESILLGAFMPVSLEELDECVPLQFTGMLDSEGKEIYEGDIVKTQEGDLGVVSFGRFESSHEGGFSRGHFHYGFFLQRSDGKQVWNDCREDVDIDSLTLVGNIFEHKNLLPDHERR